MVIISADRTVDLTADMYDRFGIKTVPYHIYLDGKDYLDNVDIELDGVFAAYEDHGSLPQTSAVNAEEYLRHFKELRHEHHHCDIVHITLGSKLSSSYQNCCAAAEQLKNVYVVDSNTLSSASGLQVMDAVEMAKEGKSGEEIKNYLDEHSQCYHASFVLDTLEYLKAGGRCSSVSALAAAALNIKPSVIVNGFEHASMVVSKKYRGKFDKVLRKYVAEKLTSYDDIDYKRCMITYSTQHDKIDIVEIAREALLENAAFEEIYVTRASCTIGCHCGPGCIGILFKTESNCL